MRGQIHGVSPAAAANPTGTLGTDGSVTIVAAAYERAPTPGAVDQEVSDLLLVLAPFAPRDVESSRIEAESSRKPNSLTTLLPVRRSRPRHRHHRDHRRQAVTGLSARRCADASASDVLSRGAASDQAAIASIAAKDRSRRFHPNPMVHVPRQRRTRRARGPTTTTY